MIIRSSTFHLKRTEVMETGLTVCSLSFKSSLMEDGFEFCYQSIRGVVLREQSSHISSTIRSCNRHYMSEQIPYTHRWKDDSHCFSLLVFSSNSALSSTAALCSSILSRAVKQDLQILLSACCDLLGLADGCSLLGNSEVSLVFIDVASFLML